MHFLSLLSQLPLRVEAKRFADSEKSLFDEGEEPKRRGVFVFEVFTGDEELDKRFSIKSNEKEEAQERVKDSSNIGKNIKNGQISNVEYTIFLGSCEIESDASSSFWLIILSFNKCIKLESFRCYFVILKGEDAVVFMEGIFYELEVNALHEFGVFVAEVSDGGGPELGVIVGI